MPDNEVPIKITGDASSLKDATDAAKKHLKQAGESVEMLGDLIGVKVPSAIKDMLASSALIAPALDAAFAPLAIISLGVAFIDATDKISKFVGEALTGAGGLRKFDEQLKAENKTLEEYARKTKEATRALELLNAPDQKARNALKLQFQIEDQGGSAAKLEELLKTKTAELQELLHKTTTETVGDAATGMQTEVETLASATRQGQEDIEQLSSAILLLGARQKEAAAEEALTNKQNQNDLDRESAQRKALESQQAAAAEQQSARRAAAAAEVQKSFEDALHRHNKILTAKELETQAAKEDAKAAEALARYHEQQVKSTQQEAALAEKGAENNAKIEQLQRDITDNQAKHNAALSVALGYTTQEKADAQALGTLEKDKSSALDGINSRLTAQQAIVKQLGIDTMYGMLGSPEQKAALQKAVLDYQKLKIDELNIEKKYDDQIAGLQLKLANTSTAQLRKQMLQWQNVHQEMANQFMTSLNSMNQSLTSFVVTGQGSWKNLASSAIESMVSMVLKYEESKAIMEILDALGLTKKKISNAAEAHSSANTASANTLADVPYPLNIPAAALVLSVGEGLAVDAMSSAGGEWRVDRDRLNFVHANETILPAGIAGKLRNMVEGGASSGGGVTVVVNHSVSAVDSTSFQGHIRRHGNMIANEVTRALKRKGVR
jgi:hypothetical protein